VRPPGFGLPCRHCRRKPVNRPRGLCWTCYYAPGLREGYPSTSKFAKRGIQSQGRRLATPEPTPYLPGTPEKVAVLEARAEDGEELWHPDDGRRGLGLLGAA
jgi:hypothetical protein